MDSFDTNDREGAKKRRLTVEIHRTLAHSYITFFLFFLAGIFLDTFYPVKIFQGELPGSFGLVLILGATALIFWAQRTSKNLKHESPTVDHFCQGPYYLSRSPTHWGLFLLMLGFGAIMNSGILTFFALLAFFLTKMIFIRREEATLAKKYGAAYLEYKRRVRL